VPFWERHSIDRAHGGFFTCLDRAGRVYSTDKYLWLQSRAVWMFARLHNACGGRHGWLDLALEGAAFIRRHGRAADGRVYFSVTQDGRPIHIQRKIYAEVFYVIAMTELAAATGRAEFLDEARGLFWQTYERWRTPASLGRPVFAGTPRGSSLADPMVFLGMIEELEKLDHDPRYTALAQEMKTIALRHVDPERKLVLEHVGPEGAPLDSPRGRLLNPGHAIELGWFLLHLARRTGDAPLVDQALNIIDWSFTRGWDRTYGGLFYFLDADRRPPLQLEWSMKLWWPMTEALYALLLAWHVSGKKRFLDRHLLVRDWSFKHLRDPKHGEWFGYLDRRGERTHDCKGGEWKGFFHLPRALLYSIQLLERIAA
ncbi:N-acylglucosamine 2-epimerase, partial [bacterium]|nr:N-acylglucosamine 2-epimerase [bacterium]